MSYLDMKFHMKVYLHRKKSYIVWVLLLTIWSKALLCMFEYGTTGTQIKLQHCATCTD